jgi:predicted transcriptional regulator
MKDQELADAIGVARASVINYCTGKTNWDVLPEQSDAVEALLADHARALANATGVVT